MICGVDQMSKKKRIRKGVVAYIDLSTKRPSPIGVVDRQHPDTRPQPVPSWIFSSYLYTAVFQTVCPVGGDTCTLDRGDNDFG